MKSIKGVTRSVENVECVETEKAAKVLKEAGKKVGVYPSATGWVIRIHHKSVYFDYHPLTKKIVNTKSLNKKSAWSQLRSHKDVIKYISDYCSGKKRASVKQVEFIKKLSKELGIRANTSASNDIQKASDEITKLLEMKKDSDAQKHFIKTGGV